VSCQVDSVVYSVSLMAAQSPASRSRIWSAGLGPTALRRPRLSPVEDTSPTGMPRPTGPRGQERQIRLNLCVKKVKGCGHGFRKFEHYRLRVLLHTGGITWPDRPRAPRIRSRRSPTQSRGAVIPSIDCDGSILALSSAHGVGAGVV